MDHAESTGTKGNLLVIEDDLSARQTLEELLTHEGYEVRFAPNGQTGLMFAQEEPPELILLDIRLPDLDGYQVCRFLKQGERTRRIPVIFFTAPGEVRDKVEGFEAGGMDYITKPFHVEEVLARVGTHLDLKRTEAALQRTNAEFESRVAERTAELEDRMRFERLLSDLSAKFVNLPPDRVDLEIEHGLRQILEFLQVDRCGLVRTLPGRSTFQITHLASGEDVPPIPAGVELPISLYPWSYEKLIFKREVVAYSKLDDLPPEANVDKQTWTEWGIRSNVNIPILIGEPVDHIIAINAVRSERVWPEEFLQRLQLLGEIFVNALDRKHSRLDLEERFRFERFISELSARFVNIAAEETEAEITTWLRRIAEFFEVDRCNIGLFSEDGAELVRAFEYHAGDTEPGPESLSKEIAPWYLDQLIRGNPVVINSVEDVPAEAEKERHVFLAKGMKSLLSIPVASGGKTLGSCVLVSVRAERVWPEALMRGFGLVTEVFANALKRKEMEEERQEHLREIEDLKQRLEMENVSLREEINLEHVHQEIVGRSAPMMRVLAQVEQVARTDSTVLLQGETGTGKELIARAIHQLSSRKSEPLVTVNCASLPPTLMENELFGREKGAYTGAMTRMVGRFETAHGATLFLDEIGELPLELQSKLLRSLEEGRFERLGSTVTIQVNVRIIAASNRDLEQEVNAGKFRRDLFYRLNVFRIVTPPLREHPEDIPMLVWAFVRQFERKMGKRIDKIPRKSVDALQIYHWPGNVRELRNVIENAMIVTSGRTLSVPVPDAAKPAMLDVRTLEDCERNHILGVLNQVGWRIGGKRGAAELLGLKRTTLQSKMKKLGILCPRAE
jgi:formate hydrogenlyase transcriptional activator